MGKTQSLPILITGGGRRIGLALAWHFINQKQPVIVSYRTHYPAIDGLIKAGAQCIQADFSTNDGVMAFADEVLKAPMVCVLFCITPARGWRKTGSATDRRTGLHDADPR